MEYNSAMKKLFFILSLFTFYKNANAINYFVSDISGNNKKDGLSVKNAFKTIQRAADLTLPGDTVFVMSGMYENSCPDCSVVTIVRSGKANAWIVFRNYRQDIR